MSINHFEYRYAWLSSRCPITVRLEEFPGRVFPTADNAYWALIYPDWVDKLSYAEESGPREWLDTWNSNEANRNGMKRAKETFINNRAIFISEEKAIGTMRKVTRAKFDQNPQFKKLLVKTNGHKLFYFNTWDDTFWGLKTDPWGHFVGKNWLGRILMELRAEYIKEATKV